MSISKTEPTAIKRVYPHVSEVQDWRTQSTLRLLWDRVHDLTEQLQAAQTTITDLVAGHNTNAATLDSVGQDAQQALALGQDAGTGVGRAGSGAGGAGGTGLPATAPNMMGVLESVLASQTWNFASEQALNGRGAFMGVAVPAMHAVDPNFGHIQKRPGQNQYLGHAVDAFAYKCADGTTAEIYDCLTDTGLIWLFKSRTALNLAIWYFP